MILMKEHEQMDGEAIRTAVARIAHEILEKNKDTENLALVGIYTRGAYLADRLAANIREYRGIDLPVGKMDITLYRDDRLRTKRIIPAKIDFNVSKSKIVLVDDVLSTGRTIRAALDEIMDYGRPDLVQLAALVDRGHRELPIHPDYVGKNISTSIDDYVRVKLKEIDGVDKVVTGKKSQ